MNDIERAMAILRDGDWWDHLHFETPDEEGAYDELNKALDTAIAALQAQLDRERELEQDDLIGALCDYIKLVYIDAYVAGQEGAEIFDDGLDADIYLGVKAVFDKYSKSLTWPEPYGWIKLSEGPPEEYTPVFIAVDGKRIGKGEIRHSHNGRYWYDYEMRGSIDFYSVTHWMPLPEPPKEERT